MGGSQPLELICLYYCIYFPTCPFLSLQLDTTCLVTVDLATFQSDWIPFWIEADSASMDQNAHRALRKFLAKEANFDFACYTTMTAKAGSDGIPAGQEADVASSSNIGSDQSSRELKKLFSVNKAGSKGLASAQDAVGQRLSGSRRETQNGASTAEYHTFIFHPACPHFKQQLQSLGLGETWNHECKRKLIGLTCINQQPTNCTNYEVKMITDKEAKKEFLQLHNRSVRNDDDADGKTVVQPQNNDKDPYIYAGANSELCGGPHPVCQRNPSLANPCIRPNRHPGICKLRKEVPATDLTEEELNRHAVVGKLVKM